MKGTCAYKDKTCKFTHPEVCNKWRKGLCTDQKKCNYLHGERPVQRARKLHTLANVSEDDKKQKRSSSKKSSGSGKDTKANGKSSKKSSKKDKKNAKKDSGHVKKRSDPR